MKHSPENAIDSAAKRNAIRREGIAKREAMAADEHQQRSHQIETRLELELRQHAPGMLAFCWPYRAEFDARALVTRLLSQGWRACLPVVGENVGPMHFREWTPETPMQADKHGILTPQSGIEVKPDVLLLPFNAIDAQGYRLGYGAGYFDRTLASLQPAPYVIGVGFALAKVDTVYPQAHDIPVQCCITEIDLYHF
ncbi:MAG TPA: 5-formyltetrahydrofolate cyclo-ligase [Rhodocyclaceae bacterium]|nr:5-formyltetrahydrofolate cyclo-ligase [Rhodocyclaceae bacterium]